MGNWLAKKLKRKAPVAPPLFCLAVEIDGNWLYWTWKRKGAPVSCKRPPAGALWRVSGFDYLAPIQERSKKFLIKQGRSFLREKPTWVFYNDYVAFTSKGKEQVAGIVSRPITASIIEEIKDLPFPALLSMELPGGMVAFAAMKRKGEITGWMVASVEDAEIIGVRLAQNEGIVDAQKIALPCVQELIEKSGPVRTYPIEPEWAGTPVRVIRRAVFGVSIGLAVSASITWLSGQHNVDRAHQHYVVARHALSERRAQVGAWNRAHIDYVVKKSGIDIKLLMSAVTSLSIPGGRASITNGGNQIVIYVPRRGFGTLATGEWSSRRAIDYGLNHPVPPGWRLASLVRSGSQGQYALIYNRSGS